MPEIKYVGPYEAVDVVGLGVVKRGEPVDAPADVAASLLEQRDNWQAVKPKPVAKKEDDS